MKSAVLKYKFWSKILASIGLGLIWTLAYPTWNIVGFVWVVPGCLIAISAGSNGKSIFAWGYLVSWIHAATALYWLLNMPHFVGAVAGWLALSIYVAIYPALWACVCWKIISKLKDNSFPQKKTNTLQWLRSLSLIKSQQLALIGAILWCGTEWIVSNLLTGFPWLLLGATQLTWSPLAQSAALGGVPLISFIIVWTSLSVSLGISRSRLNSPNPWKWIPDAILPICIVIGLNIFGFLRIQAIDSSRPEETFRVALIQPAFPQDLIWDAQEDQSRFEELVTLSTAALQLDADLLVWPEGAFPGNIESFKPVWDMLNQYQVSLCFNGTDVDTETLNFNNPTIFNAAFLMNSAGKLKGTYHKRHLVMFGEYVPFSEWLPFLKLLTPIEQLFSPGDQSQAFHLPEQDVYIYPLICFEDVVPYLSHETTQEIDYILNLTNDGWFKESAAQFQHANLAAFRSIETGLPMIRCGNNGLTCWIDPAGRRDTLGPTGNHLDIYGRSFCVVDIPQGWEVPATFYQSKGKHFSIVCFLASGVCCFSMFRKKKSKNIDLII